MLTLTESAPPVPPGVHRLACAACPHIQGVREPASEAAHLQGRPRASTPARRAGLVSEDMARERQRRAWEAGEHGVLAAELAEEAAQRERIQARRRALAHALWLDTCTCPPLCPLLQLVAALNLRISSWKAQTSVVCLFIGNKGRQLHVTITRPAKIRKSSVHA